MSHALVRILGWPATILHGDQSTFDRWLWLRRHLQKGPLRTLDAGCGAGPFVLYAAKLGNDAVGIDGNERNVRVGRERAALLGLPATFVHGDLRSMELAAATFDQIICTEVIEHILDDRGFLSRVAALLAPGGRLLLTAPYKFYHPLPGDRVSAVEDGGHVRWGYTHDELRELFDAVGLTIADAEYVSGAVTQGTIRLARYLAGPLGSHAAWALTAPLRLARLADGPLTRLLRYPNLSVAVVGIKAPAQPLNRPTSR